MQGAYFTLGTVGMSYRSPFVGTASPDFTWPRDYANRLYVKRRYWPAETAPTLSFKPIEGFDREEALLRDLDFARSLRETIYDFKPKYISKLIRIVRDWTGAAQLRQALPLRNPSAAHDLFHWQLNLGRHPLLDRPLEKTAWLWFMRWRQVALRAARDGFSGQAMLDLLRQAIDALRRRPILAHPPDRRRLSERLEQLAGTIVSHAPPRLPPRGELLAEAG
jgi:hypothetical protein